MDCKYFAISIILLFTISFLSNYPSYIKAFGQIEDFDGLHSNALSKLIPKNIVAYNESISPSFNNKTEIDKAIEDSYISPNIIITNKNYSVPVNTTIIPNATVLDQKKLSNFKNISSFLYCKFCYQTYVKA